MLAVRGLRLRLLRRTAEIRDAVLLLSSYVDDDARTRATRAIACAAPGKISAAGWTAPTVGGPPARWLTMAVRLPRRVRQTRTARYVGSEFRTADRPNHYGVDITAPKGTPIHAAAAGTVITVTCNAHTTNGDPYSCDDNGSPFILGCGWYLRLLHADRTVTRYCHMLRQPFVQVGQTVTVGQVIGLVGTSGYSSGPHLHLKAHLGPPATPQNAVAPLAFAQRGVAL